MGGRRDEAARGIGVVSNGAQYLLTVAAAYDALAARFLTKRINHSECYWDGQACTNMVESFFSRTRRAEIGTHHHFAGKYLYAYA